MKTISKITGFLVVLIFIACSNLKRDAADVVYGQEPILVEEAQDVKLAEPYNDYTAAVYFKASGTEPFWSLEITDKQLIFRTPEDSLIANHVEPERAMDSNVKWYRAKGAAGDLDVIISQDNCINEMSGTEFPYSVKVEIKKSEAKQPQTVNGCGEYITDYRLHDIWVLEVLEGKKVALEDFGKELPVMEIYAATNVFSGFAGCNRMNGKLFFETGLLRFTDIATTKMMCASPNKETAFIKALRNVTSYEIGNNRLTLSNPDGELLVLKKVD